MDPARPANEDSKRQMAFEMLNRRQTVFMLRGKAALLQFSGRLCFFVRFVE